MMCSAHIGWEQHSLSEQSIMPSAKEGGSWWGCVTSQEAISEYWKRRGGKSAKFVTTVTKNDSGIPILLSSIYNVQSANYIRAEIRIQVEGSVSLTRTNIIPVRHILHSRLCWITPRGWKWRRVLEGGVSENIICSILNWILITQFGTASFHGMFSIISVTRKSSSTVPILVILRQGHCRTQSKSTYHRHCLCCPCSSSRVEWSSQSQPILRCRRTCTRPPPAYIDRGASIRSHSQLQEG